MFSLVFRPLTRWFESEVNLVSGSVVLTAGRKAPAFRRFQCEAGRLNRTTFCENCCMDVLQCFQQGVAGHLVDYKKNPHLLALYAASAHLPLKKARRNAGEELWRGKEPYPLVTHSDACCSSFGDRGSLHRGDRLCYTYRSERWHARRIHEHHVGLQPHPGYLLSELHRVC